MPRGYLFAGEEEADAEVIVLVVVEGGRPSCKLVIREQGVDLDEASSKEGGAREDEDEDKEPATCCRNLKFSPSNCAIIRCSRRSVSSCCVEDDVFAFRACSSSCCSWWWGWLKLSSGGGTRRLYGPLPSILSEAVLPTRLLMGLVAATVAAEGEHEDDEVDRPRRGTKPLGESKGEGSVRGASLGGECGMVVALSRLPCDSRIEVEPNARLSVCVVWVGREGR